MTSHQCAQMLLPLIDEMMAEPSTRCDAEWQTAWGAWGSPASTAATEQ